MNDLFKNTLMVCTAVSTFSGGAYLGVSAINQHIDSRIQASVSADAGADESGAKSLSQTLRKLQQLLK